jgi:hypothetical protein
MFKSFQYDFLIFNFNFFLGGGREESIVMTMNIIVITLQKGLGLE